jgi:hypothetical protein
MWRRYEGMTLMGCGAPGKRETETEKNSEDN